MHRALSSVVLSIAATLLCGCPSKQIITETPTVEGADDQQATCKVAKDPLNPLIVEWPGTSKVDLDSASQQGTVVVSYAGCTLKVLTSCKAGGAYELTSVTPARDKLQIADQNELYARLPLGAASLKGELSLGSSLELDYIAVGQRIAKKAPRLLSGDCAGATHYVRTITVGAYSLDARAKGKAGASVEVGSAGGGIGRAETSRRLRGSGNVEGCESDPAGKDCGAVLQLGLAPIKAQKGGEVLDSAGFGANIGPLGVVPTVSELPDVVSVGASSLQKVDVEYLSLVQDARRAEKDSSLPAEERGRRWQKVADARADGAYHEVALERVEEWRLVAAGEARRRERLDRLRTQYQSDSSKLEQLKRMDDDLVPRAQKIAYQKEFDEVYKPYEKDLVELGLKSGGSSGSSGIAGGSGNTPPTDTTTPPPKEYAMGSRFGIEAEAGYAQFGYARAIKNASTGEEEKEYLLGGNGFMGGLNFGFTNLGDSNVGLLASFRTYAGNGTALAFGGILRWSPQIAEIVRLELGIAGYYGLYVTPTQEIDVDWDVDCNENAETPEERAGCDEAGEKDIVLGAAGGEMDLLAGLLFNFDPMVFGVRGGALIGLLSATSDDGDAQAAAEASSSATIGPMITGTVGVEF
jgi:hypothetical protein